MNVAPASTLLALVGAAALVSQRPRAGAGASSLGRLRMRRSATRLSIPRWIEARLAAARARLVLVGGTTLRRHLATKLLAAATVPALLLLPRAALERREPSLLVAAPLALAGFLLPELALRRALRRRRERVLLDLPEALSMLSLALAAGRSLHQALTLAAQETGGPLGADIGAALSLARREPGIEARAALVTVARAGGEPSFIRFAELLASKESPYLAFLRSQAAQARAEQSRVLDRAADRAYLAMHAPLAPLLATLVLLVAYGFLHVLDQSI